MNRFALILGIETTVERMRPVVFAENDAYAFRDCLLELGYDARDVMCLTRAQATKLTIESELRRVVTLAQEGDEVVLFFAGHVLAINSANYIVAHDTVKADLENTCISLKWILDLFNTSRSVRKILFIDGCHSGLVFDEPIGGIVDAMNEADLSSLFDRTEYGVGFVSCHADECSYRSPTFKHGIWTYHVLRALRGEAEQAVVKNKTITPVSLQNYLTDEVPKTLSVENPNPVIQRPWCFGNFSHPAPIFDVGAIIEKRRGARKARFLGVKTTDLLGATGGYVRELSGFKKGFHREPDSVDRYTESFVAELAGDDVDVEANALYQQIKNNFGYKRREIALKMDGASAAIATKDFDLSVTYFQSSVDPSAYMIEYRINNVRDAHVLNDDGLQQILNRHFNEIRFSIKGEIDLEELIDEIESEEIENVSIEYPADCSRLKITLAGAYWSLHLTEAGVSIISHSLGTPNNMLTCYGESQTLASNSATLSHLLELE